jgi:hypothetical protein
MGETAENVAARIWRDRAQIREDERDGAQARARLAEKLRLKTISSRAGTSSSEAERSPGG